MSEIKLAPKVSDQLLLCDYNHTRIEELFTIEEITPDRRVVVSDASGRVFLKTETSQELWIHSNVLIRFPVANLVRATKDGYRTQMEFMVTGGLRLHYVNHAREQFPHLFVESKL